MLKELVSLRAAERYAEIVLSGGLEGECASYLIFKRKRLTVASQQGYAATLRKFVFYFPGKTVEDFEPPTGSIMVERFMTSLWGSLSPRTYNKNLSVVHDFFDWEMRRGRIQRDPTASIERARARTVHRTTFSEEECSAILAANPGSREQVALKLLLYYGLRKGGLRSVQLQHFDTVTHRLVVFTKGEKIHHLPIPDPAIWEHLASLGEPGDHYLLPRRLLRKRISPNRDEFADASDYLGALVEALATISDPACSADLATLASNVDRSLMLLSLAVESASTQVRAFPTEQIGEHGMHDLWYRWLARAGIVERGATSGKRLHTARHTSGQRVLNKTGNLKAAQALLGHASIATTGDIYTEWDIDQLAQTLADVLSPILVK